MKLRAIKTDIEYSLSLPHVDGERVQDYFEQQGLLPIYDGLTKR